MRELPSSICFHSFPSSQRISGRSIRLFVSQVEIGEHFSTGSRALRCMYSRFTSPSGKRGEQDSGQGFPLSVFSWSVDGSLHSHHGFRRRFSLEERIPHISQCIHDSQADVVALQDSTRRIRELLSRANDTQKDAAIKKKVEAPTPTPKVSPSFSSTLEEGRSGGGDHSRDAGGYNCIAWANNGRCGELQLFCRRGAPWRATPLFRGAGVSMILTSLKNTDLSNEVDGEVKRSTLSPSVASLSSLSSEISEEEKRKTSMQIIVTNVDLSYRGKSLGRHGQLWSTPYESLHGSPFSFSTSLKDHGKTTKGRRPYGQLDVFRDLALQYVSSVNQPDILVGNFYMSQSETVSGYKDAWEVGGAPTVHERTTNTFQTHRIDKKTNYYYFLPSPSPSSSSSCRHHHRHPHSVSGGKTIPESSPVVAKSASSTTETEAGVVSGGMEQQQNQLWMEGREEVVGSQGAVGIPLPLAAYRQPVPVKLIEKEAGMDSPYSLSTAVNSDTGEDTKHFMAASKWNWVVEKGDREDSPKTMNEEKLVATEQSAEVVSTDDKISLPSSYSFTLKGENNEGKFKSQNVSLEMPEVAGRYQRCLFSLKHRLSCSATSKFSNRKTSFMHYFNTARVVVLKPFTLEATLSPEETAWHVSRLSRREMKRITLSSTSEMFDSNQKDPVKITCGPSIQFPLLVQLYP